MYQGYLALGGVELANAARTAAYVAKQTPTLPLKNKYDVEGFHLAVGDPEYTSPLVDDPDWFDPARPESGDFYGFYPLAIEGVESSSRTVPIVESVLDGGTHGFGRRATKMIRVRGMLVARTDEGLEYGNEWLETALDQPDCGMHATGACGAGSLQYFSAFPKVSECCYEQMVQAGQTHHLADLARPADGPFTVDLWRDEECMPFSGRWMARDQFEEVDPRETWGPGTVVRWGYVERDTFEYVEQQGPLPIRRDNVMVNPAFRSSLATWTYTAGAAREVEGERTFIRTPAGSESFLQSQVVTAGDEPSILSFLYRLPEGESLSVSVTSSGSTVGSLEIPAEVESVWRRVYVPLSSGRAVRVRLEGSDQFDATEFLLEVGQDRGEFFDMEQPPAQAGRYGYEMQALGGTASALWEGVLERDWEINPFNVRMDWSPRTLVFDLMRGWIVNLEMGQSIFLPVPIDVQLHPYERFMHEVRAVAGPTTIREYAPTAGALREVEFYLNAGVPFRFSRPREGGYFSGRESGVGNISCPETPADPLIDPDLPPLVMPPRPPTIPTLGVDEVPSWERFWIVPPATGYNVEQDRFIYSADVPLWLTSVPTLEIQTKAQAFRQVRVRFYPNPFNRELGGGNNDQPIDLCSYCAEFIVGYVPPNTLLTVDGVAKRSWAAVNMVGTVPADHVMYGTDGVPMEWPELSCGTEYLVSIDVPTPDVGSIPEGYENDFFTLRYTDRS